jgi:hypothetical protein
MDQPKTFISFLCDDKETNSTKLVSLQENQASTGGCLIVGYQGNWPN